MISETPLRAGFFLAILSLSAAWEWAAPRRPFTAPRPPRWLSNLGLVVLDTMVVRLGLPLLALDMARLAQDRGWGLLNAFGAPGALKALAAFLALDLVIYLQHRVFHAVPLFWRLHKVHHTDVDLDGTSGVRFHPVEIWLSMVIKLGVVALLGASWQAVLAFEIVLNATSLFNHSNMLIPEPADRLLRLFLVTPDMHRVHHSVIVGETNSNYGFNLPWWDRLLGTYTSRPAEGHLGMSIGLPEYRQASLQNLWWLLALPFKR